IKIGDLLVKAGVITDLQLRAALAEQQQWGGKLGDILVRMEFLTEEILVRALSKQTGILRADLTGDPDRPSLALIPAEVAEEFGLVPIGLKDEGRTIVVAMSDPLNIGVTDHLRSLTGAKKIDSQLAGASAIRNAISRWYRGEEMLGEEGEQSSMKVVDNSGQSVVTMDPRNKGKNAPPSAPPPSTGNGAPRTSAVEVLRGVEETQRRSVAALKAMVELLIEKGVFSRDEYLARVKR
ncbi:MAG: general secretion pathway protein GspE, partial [Deltaproteobacteria bacterium]